MFPVEGSTVAEPVYLVLLRIKLFNVRFQSPVTSLGSVNVPDMAVVDSVFVLRVTGSFSLAVAEPLVIFSAPPPISQVSFIVPLKLTFVGVLPLRIAVPEPEFATIVNETSLRVPELFTMPLTLVVPVATTSPVLLIVPVPLILPNESSVMEKSSVMPWLMSPR